MVQSETLRAEKLRLQIDSFLLIVKIGIIVAVFTFIGEYVFYKNAGWTSTELINYGLLFILYLVILTGAFFGLRDQKLRQPKPDFGLSKFYIYFIAYFISAVIFIVMFMARIYGSELYYLASVNLIFGVFVLFSDTERFIYLLVLWIMYIIGGKEVTDDPALFTDINKALALNILTFIVGKVAVDWYDKNAKSRIDQKIIGDNQRANIKYLADQMQIEVGDLSNIENPRQLDNAIKSLLKEFTDSKKNLEVAMNDSEKAFQAKESFFSSMSHEIRTPLNAIIGMVRELSLIESNPKSREYQKNIEVAANHLLAIVNNILDISRLESSDLHLQEQNFSLTEVLENIIKLLENRSTENGNHIRIQVDTNIYDIYYGDMVRLRQILFNVIGNAIKYTHDGLIDIRVSLVTSSDTEERVRITISDDGIGIGPEFMDNIFEKYTQENRNAQESGSGLGLSITRELVNIMGGTIHITSEKGKGTDVVTEFLLKKGDPLEVSEDKTHAQAKIDLSTTNVLLVDDDKINRLIARQTLERAGAHVIEAYDGLDAIHQVQANKVDLILMDIQMPNMDGMEATRRLRSEVGFRGPIIALTANAFSNDLQYYIENGMDAYVTKPYDEATFYSTIDTALNQS